MLLSEIGDKEIIDLTKGSRHGLQLPWESIVKIGEDIIIFRS